MDIILKIKTLALSFFINILNGINLHNLDKFFQISKIWFNIYLDSIKGDYIEFGIFKGKSLYHSYKSSKKYQIHSKRIFWGLDSFEGFPVENHNFYNSDNFRSSYSKVNKFFSKYKNVVIVKGYFDSTLKQEDLIKVNKISFAFVDCDIYESALPVFKFLEKRISKGGFIMIDDFTSIDNKGDYIAKAFFEIFKSRTVILFDTYSNGHTYRIMD